MCKRNGIQQLFFERNGSDRMPRARINGMKKFYCFINTRGMFRRHSASRERSSRAQKLECATRRVTLVYNYTDVGHTAWDSFAPRFCQTETKRKELERRARRDEISTGHFACLEVCVQKWVIHTFRYDVLLNSPLCPTSHSASFT